MSHRNLVRCVLIGVCLVLFSPLGRAQFRASIRGTVTDPQGKAVAGATITLENTGTNKKLVSMSDNNGI